MSDSRFLSSSSSSTSDSRNQANASSREPNRQSNMSYDFFLKSIIILMGLHLAKASAAMQALTGSSQSELLHLPTDTWYQVHYPNDAPFPELPNQLVQNCNMIVGTPPDNSTDFTWRATPSCTVNGQPSGPSVDIYVESGKNLTKMFVECANKLLADLCAIYDDNNRPPHVPPHTPPYTPPTNNSDYSSMIIFFVISATVLTACVLGCVVRCCSSSSRSTINNESASEQLIIHHDHHDSSVGDGAAAAVGLLGLFGALAAASSSSSSASGGYMGNSSSNSSRESRSSGVSWGFGQTPQ